MSKNALDPQKRTTKENGVRGTLACPYFWGTLAGELLGSFDTGLILGNFGLAEGFGDL